jgi:hypothetical protein
VVYDCDKVYERETSSILCGICGVAITAAIVGSLVVASHSRGATDTRLSTTVPTGRIASLTSATSTYSNTTYGFALDYPSDLAVDEYDEGDGARTIVFRKGQQDVGFQIFVTPLSGPPISKRDIQASDPKAQVPTIVAATVGTSVPAFTFLSTAPGMGPSRELWFSHGGYAFQVTTYPDRAVWVAVIFRTWRAITATE